MAVNSVYVREIAQGDGSNTVFGFPWKFVANSDIMVYVDDVLQAPTAYDIVNPITKDFGQVVFHTAPGVGAIVVIRRADNLQQARAFKNQENFNAHEVEKAFDKLTLLVQEGFEELRRGTMRMESQSNLDYTIEDLVYNDSLLALDLPNKKFKQTSFTQEEVQTVIDNAVRSTDFTVKNEQWDGDVLTITFDSNESKKGVVSGNIAQVRAQHDLNNHWWLEWSLDGETWLGMGGATGGSPHNNLIERDAPDAHPMSSITGLTDTIAAVYEELEEFEDYGDLIDAIKTFVGYQENGALNQFIGLSNASFGASMGNSSSGGFMIYENKENNTKGTIELSGSTPRLVFESTATTPTFKIAVEIHDDGIYLSDGTGVENFVKVPSSADLGLLMKAVAVDANEFSTVKLNLTKLNTQNGALSTTQLPLPVASETQAGVWNPTMYSSFVSLQNTVNTLVNNQSIPTHNMQSSSPTSSELTTAYLYEKQTAPQAGSRLYNSFDNSVWLCLDGTNWVIVSGTAISNAIATLQVPGVVLSKNSDGMVYVENDGGMSVVGWDGLTGRMTTAESTLTTLAAAIGAMDLSAYLEKTGGTLTGDLIIQESTPLLEMFNTTSNTQVNLSHTTESGAAQFNMVVNGTTLGVRNVSGAISLLATNGVLGSSTGKWATLYTTKLNNGGDLALPTGAGTLALTSQIPTVPPTITSVVRNETTGVLTVVFTKTPTTKTAYKLANGNTIAGAWALVSGTTWRFTPTAATDITENDWGVSCS